MSDSDSSVGSVDDPTIAKKKIKNKESVVNNKKRYNKAENIAINQKNKKVKREVNAEGDEMLPVGGKKFVTVREYHGKTLIDIREYYEKESKWLPGRKGISLSREQYNDLKNLLPEIDEKIENF